MHTTLPISRPVSLPDARPFKRRLIELLLEDRRLLARIGSTALLGAFFGLALPYASKLAIDGALPDSAPRLLAVVALGVALLVAYQAWTGWVCGSTRNTLSAAVEKGALLQVMSALVRSNYAALSKRDSGWMLTTLSGAGTAVQRYVDSLATLFTHGAFSLIYFLVLCGQSVTVAAVVILFNLLIAGVCYGLTRLEARHTRTLLERNSAQQQLMHVLMAGLASLRASFASERLGARWSDRVRETSASALRCARTSAYLGIVAAIGAQTLATGIMIWGVYQCFDGELSLGDMMFLLGTSSGLSSSVMAVIGVAVGFKALAPHFERVDELFRAAQASVQAAPNPVLCGDSIVLKNVSYRYSDDGRWIVDNQSWEVKKGEVVRLDSPSGSGKTTLLRLIAGLVAPTRGKISIFGVDPMRAHALVLYVPQHCKLFEASIRENLELLSGQSYTSIARVVELTGLSRMLGSLPMGSETLVAADGQNLSSGQRQLIVLTAALASPRPVLLLDEATNQIDADTRRAWDWPMLLQGRTVITVEHG